MWQRRVVHIVLAVCLLFRYAVCQLGFVCQGYVEFKVDSISANERNELYFYSKSTVGSVIDCARLCYRKEFCRAAVFDTGTKSCHFSYFKGSCDSATERVREEPQIRGFVRITCIRCELGHHLDELLKTTHETTTPPSIFSPRNPTSTPFTKPRFITSHTTGESSIFQTAPKNRPSSTRHPKIPSIFSALESRPLTREKTTFAGNARKVVRPSISIGIIDPADVDNINKTNRAGNGEVLRIINKNNEAQNNRNNNQEVIATGLEAKSITSRQPFYPAHNGFNSRLDPTNAFKDDYEERRKKQKDFDKWSQSCFYGVRQKVLLGSGLHTERGVTLLECQCLCARSRVAGLYTRQCKSIVYYASRHECVLSAEDRLSATDHPFVQLSSSQHVTYHEFFCHRTRNEIQSYVGAVCDYISGQTGTSTPPPAPVPRRSDMCYEEVKEYLLRDSAVAIRSRIPLKDCKCLCASSHQPHSPLHFTCMSLMYYYDDSMCILNKDTQERRPDLFQQDITTYAVTYYQFTCANDYPDVSTYMSHHCSDSSQSLHLRHFT